MTDLAVERGVSGGGEVGVALGEREVPDRQRQRHRVPEGGPGRGGRGQEGGVTACTHRGSANRTSLGSRVALRLPGGCGGGRT